VCCIAGLIHIYAWTVKEAHKRPLCYMKSTFSCDQPQPQQDSPNAFRARCSSSLASLFHALLPHSLSCPPAALACRPFTPQTESKFAQAYAAGIHKSKYWEPFFEDSLDLIAKLPTIAAMIYRRTYKGGDYIAPDPKLDWAANLSHMMGFDDPGALEMMRLYQTIHSDHEGGNVSAHSTHLVGSALSDPYLSFAAGMCGLAGPLHGLANQEVLRWLQDVQAEVRV